MITPELIANGGSESDHQKALFCWAALHLREYPELEYMFAIPNGGKRDKITAARMKAEGVKAGVPDIFLPIPREICMYGLHHWTHGLYIEMKIGSNEPSSAQLSWLLDLSKLGYKAIVCYGWVEAVAAIQQYLRR